MGKKITQYPNNVSTNPDNLSLLDLSEKTGASTFESRKWNLTAFKAWVNSWVVAGAVAWNDITGKPTGTVNKVAKFTTTTDIGDSIITDTGEFVGVSMPTPTAKLHINNLTAYNSFLVEDDTNEDVSPFVVNHLGFVGIGIKVPFTDFVINGSTAIASNLGSNSARPAVAGYELDSGEIRGYSTENGELADDGFLRISAGGGTNGGGKAYIDISGYSNLPDMDRNIVFGTVGVERMRLTSTGNLGIGIDTPNSKLDVYSMNTGANHKGVKIYTESGTNTTGLYVESLASTAGDGIGAEITSTQNTVGVTTYGVKAYGKGAGGLDLARSLVSYGLWAESNGGVQNIGLYAKTYGTSGTNYSCQLIDGTEDVDKILKSVTNDGKANWANFPCEVQLACSDETTALTTGVKTTIRIPNNMRVTEVRASLTTPQTSGSILTIDLLEGGVSSIFGTKLTVDNGETTSKTALTPPTFSASPPTSYYLADDTEIKVSITQIGDGTAKGLKILIKGYRVSW